MKQPHPSQNSHIPSFQDSILKNKELKSCKGQLLQQLEIKSVNTRHQIMIHHSICNLNRNMINMFCFISKKITAVHLSKGSASLKVQNQLLCYCLQSTGFFQHNKLKIPPSSLNHISIFTIPATVNLILMEWRRFISMFLYCLTSFELFANLIQSF